MALRKRRPPCRNCESVSLTRMSGCWANDGTIPVSYYRCNDCGQKGMTGEFWLPDEASLSALDFDRRLASRVLRRRQRGTVGHDTRGGRRISSDTVESVIRIIPGKVQRGLAKRLAALRRKAA